jgi:hypothetical protein
MPEGRYSASWAHAARKAHEAVIQALETKQAEPLNGYVDLVMVYTPPQKPKEVDHSNDLGVLVSVGDAWEFRPRVDGRVSPHLSVSLADLGLGSLSAILVGLLRHTDAKDAMLVASKQKKGIKSPAGQLYAYIEGLLKKLVPEQIAALERSEQKLRDALQSFNVASTGPDELTQLVKTLGLPTR